MVCELTKDEDLVLLILVFLIFPIPPAFLTPAPSSALMYNIQQDSQYICAG